MDKKYLGSPIEVPAINFWNLCGFIASNNGRICKIENNGKIEQFLKISGEIQCPIFYDKNYFYMITTQKMLWRIHYLTAQVDTVPINTTCRGTPLIYNEKIYIPGLKEFVIIDQKNLLILNQMVLSNPIFANAFLWKNFVIGICAVGEIITAKQDNIISSFGFGPPVSETPLIFQITNEIYDIWCFGGYFQSLLFAKVYYKNKKISIEPFKRLIFPKSTGIINIPLKIIENLWTISCHRCNVFFFTSKQLYNIFETNSTEDFKVISTILQPENSSLVQPKFYQISKSPGFLFFSTRNDSVVLMDISELLLPKNNLIKSL
uniref:Uncharacterized protein n=1 Tax=Panagrolaimus sp. PS1159 TaxID=55785 RepID=A0AC35EUV0_9BILA